MKPTQRKGVPRELFAASITPSSVDVENRAVDVVFHTGAKVQRGGFLGNLWRRLVLPKRIDSWSLTSVQQRLVKTGGRLVKHARYYWLLLAESHLTRRLFGAMLQRIWALPVPTG